MSIQEFKTKVEDLSAIMAAYTQEADEIIKDRDYLNERERKIREIEKDVMLRFDDLKHDQDRLEEERIALQHQQSEVHERRKQVEKDKGTVDDALKELESLKQQTLKEQEEQRKLEDSLKTLRPQFDELQIQQSLIDKEKAIDRQRKEFLDMREEKIKRREQQLQMNADI